MDLQFTASMNPHEGSHHFRRRGGRVAEDMERYHQIGRYSGWIEVEGQRSLLRPNSGGGSVTIPGACARAELRTDESRLPVTQYPPLFFIWSILQFDDHGVHLFANERAPGDSIYLSGEQVFPLGEKVQAGQRVVAFSHDIEWEDDPLGQSVKTAYIGLNLRRRPHRGVRAEKTPGSLLSQGRPIWRTAWMVSRRRQREATHGT